MRKWTVVLRSAVALGGLSLLAQAQDEAAKESPRKPAAEQQSLFDRIDQNQDGQISADEISEERKSFFERLLRGGDKNGDGKVSREEFAAAAQAGRRPGSDNATDDNRPPRGQGDNASRGQFFRSLDKNGDGKIMLDEIPEERRERLKPIMSRGDKDGDGSLTQQEFAAAMGALGGRRPDGGQAGRGGPMGRPNPANAPFFRAIDSDRDGKLSGDELAKAGEALKTLDKNGDGSLTPEELIPPPPSGAAAPGNPQAGAAAMMERLKQADANGDGKLSKDEAPERMKENFARLDANSDGQLDQAEMRQMFERFRGNQPNDRPNRPRNRDRNADSDNKDAKDGEK